MIFNSPDKACTFVYMNKTRFDYLGGHPLMLNNFEFMQDSIREAIFQILESCKGFAAGINLTGLQFSTPAPTTIAWTSGYMYTQGEFYYCPAGQITGVNPATARLRANPNFLYPGNLNPVIYADGSSKQVHEVRQRQITMVSPSAGPDPSDPRNWQPLGTTLLPTISAFRMAHHIDLMALIGRLQTYDPFHVVGDAITGLGTTLLNLWANAGGTHADLSFRINSINQVVFKGVVARGNQSTSAAQIFTLPANYRPASRTVLNILQFEANNLSNVATWTGQKSAICYIEPTGEVYIRGLVTPTAPIHSFDGVFFNKG